MKRWENESVRPLLCPCCRRLPNEYLDNLLAVNRVLFQLGISLPFPLVLLSGYRCPRQNLKVGGRKDSPHLRGLAADLYVGKPRERFLLIKSLILLGVNRIVLYGDMPSVLHFDLAEDKGREVFFLRSQERLYV